MVSCPGIFIVFTQQKKATVSFNLCLMPLFFCGAQCFPLCDIHHLVVIYKKTRFAIFSGIYEVELKFMTNLRNNKEQKHTSGLFGSFLLKSRNWNLCELSRGGGGCYVCIYYSKNFTCMSELYRRVETYAYASMFCLAVRAVEQAKATHLGWPRHCTIHSP